MPARIVDLEAGQDQRHGRGRAGRRLHTQTRTIRSGRRSKPSAAAVDIVTLADALSDRSIGAGRSDLLSLISAVAHAAHYVRIVRGHVERRRVIEADPTAAGGRQRRPGSAEDPQRKVDMARRAEPPRPFDLADVPPTLDRLLSEASEVRLVVIDPVGTSRGAIDSYRNTELQSMRPARRPRGVTRSSP